MSSIFQATDAAIVQDSLATNAASSAYDSIWANPNVPVAAPDVLEQVMLAEDRLYVVLAVVLVIWFGIVVLLARTDRKIKRLEDQLPNSNQE